MLKSDERCQSYATNGVCRTFGESGIDCAAPPFACRELEADWSAGAVLVNDERQSESSSWQAKPFYGEGTSGLRAERKSKAARHVILTGLSGSGMTLGSNL